MKTIVLIGDGLSGLSQAVNRAAAAISVSHEVIIAVPPERDSPDCELAELFAQKMTEVFPVDLIVPELACDLIVDPHDRHMKNSPYPSRKRRKGKYNKY